MEQASASLLQQALDAVEKLPPEDQETLVELIQRRLVEQRRAEIAQNAAVTLQAVREGQARYGAVENLMSGLDILKSVQYVVNQKGKPAAVQIDIEVWESLLDWLEDLDDRALVKVVLPRLRMGPEKAGALLWDEVKAEWDVPGSELAR